MLPTHARELGSQSKAPPFISISLFQHWGCKDDHEVRYLNPLFPSSKPLLYPLPIFLPNTYRHKVTNTKMRLRLKGLTLPLLLVLLVLCSSVSVCDARSGKHWRQNKAPSISMLRRKGKGKNGNSHRQYGKGYQNPYQPSPSTSPNVPVSPSGSPVQGKGHQGPTMPTPSVGNGYAPPLPPPPPLLPPPPPAAPSQDTVFNVVDFGAQGDGVTDDTQVTSTTTQNPLLQTKKHVSPAPSIPN